MLQKSVMKNLFLSAFLGLVIICFFVFSKEALSGALNGILICGNTLIPSLFPFMIVSEIFVASGGASLIGRLLSPIFGKLFGISGEGCVSYILGMLCGFPVGIRSAISLYERGIIDKRELEHLSAFCNGPSSAFLISAVGSSLFGSKQFGIMLYASHVITSTLMGVIARFYFATKGESSRPENYFRCDKASPSGVAASIVSAVNRSAISMLYICAFVVFFSSTSPILTSLCEKLGLPAFINTLLIGAFEMTGGAFAAASLTPSLAVPAIAAVTFWSGLSVFFQFVGLVGEHKISLFPYLVSKLAGALVCPVVLLCICSAC